MAPGLQSESSQRRDRLTTPSQDQYEVPGIFVLSLGAGRDVAFRHKKKFMRRAKAPHTVLHPGECVKGLTECVLVLKARFRAAVQATAMGTSSQWQWINAVNTACLLLQMPQAYVFL